MLRPGDTVAGRFLIERIIGSGGMGIVARAADRQRDTAVALKTLVGGSELEVERFGREVSVVARLNHAHVVAYVDHGELPDGQPWLAMEWIEGCTLAELLRSHGLGLAQTIALARGLAAGLAAAHEAGVIHRDIKPTNLLLPDGDPAQVKIADFGVARLADAHALTRTGSTIGTPGYMAPEQVQGTTTVDPRCDLFSVGAVLFECLANRPAFLGEHAVTVMAKVLLEDQPRLRELRPQIPPAVDELIARLLAKRPADRPADGSALVRALDQLHTGDYSEPEPATSEVVTDSEQRLVSLVLVEQYAAALDETVPAVFDATVSPAPGDTAGDPLHDIASRHRARYERLLDGTALLILAGRRAPGDLALSAARAAHEAMVIPGQSRIAVATGRAMLSDRWPVGEAIEEAARLLAVERTSATQRVRLDELTAGLVRDRFDLDEGDHGYLLGAEHRRATTEVPVAEQPCLGRERELGLMRGVLAECVEEQAPRALLVVAPPGAGKSRLVAELENRVGSEVTWLHAQADALRTAAPFTLARDMLHRSFGPDCGDIAEISEQIAGSVAGDDRERIATFLFELAFSFAGRTTPPLLQAARRQSQLMADQLRQAVTDWLAASASERPCVVVLEDVHWADSTSLALILAMLDRVAVPLLIVATARPEVDRRPFERSGASCIELSELGLRASARLVRHLAPDADDDRVASVLDRAGGNPFLLEELARAAARGDDAELPRTALAMAQARLEELSPEQRRVLRAAAIFGRAFFRDGVAALVGDLAELDAVLHALVRERLLVRDEHEVLLFRHDLLREAAYGSLPAEDCRGGHRGAGRWLETQPNTPPLLIAEHLHRGGDHLRAAPHFAAAGRDALHRGELDGTEHCVRRGLEARPDAQVRGQLELLMAEVHIWRGENEPALRHADTALDILAPASVDWLHAANVVFQSAGRLGDASRVRSVLAPLRALRDSAADARDEWLISAAMGVRELLRCGDYELAAEVLEEVDAQLALAGDVDAQLSGVIAYVRSIAALHGGDLVGQLTQLEQALAHYRRAGNAREACAMRGELGFSYCQLGAFDRARRQLDACLAGAENLGLDHVRAWVLTLLVSVHTETGDIAAAIDTGRDAADALHHQDDERMEGAARAYLALALVAHDDLDAALDEANRAAQLLEPFPPLLGFALGVIGVVRLAREETNLALAATSRGVTIRDQLGGLEEGDALLLEAHADALHADGQLEPSAQVRGSAQALVRDRAEAIRDPDLRRAFENNIAVHQRLLAG